MSFEKFKVSKSILTRPPNDVVKRQELIATLKEITTFAKQVTDALSVSTTTITRTTTSGNGYFPQGWG